MPPNNQVASFSKDVTSFGVKLSALNNFFVGFLIHQIALAIRVLTSSIGVRVRRFFGFVLGGLSGRVRLRGRLMFSWWSGGVYG